MITKKRLRLLGYGLGGLIVAGLLAYIIVVRPLQVRGQKAQFDKAEAQLDALATQIEQTIGKPDDQSKTKNCDKPNLKSQKGPLSCSTAIHLFFANKDALQATDLMKKITLLVGATDLKLLGKSVSGFVSTNDYRGDQNISQQSSSIEGLSCGAQYIYPVLAKLDQYFKPTQPENLEVSISCSRSTISQFFPLKD